MVFINMVAGEDMAPQTPVERFMGIPVYARGNKIYHSTADIPAMGAAEPKEIKKGDKVAVEFLAIPQEKENGLYLQSMFGDEIKVYDKKLEG
jgi:hypothetical protein